MTYRLTTTVTWPPLFVQNDMFCRGKGVFGCMSTRLGESGERRLAPARDHGADGSHGKDLSEIR